MLFYSNYTILSILKSKGFFFYLFEKFKLLQIVEIGWEINKRLNFYPHVKISVSRTDKQIERDPKKICKENKV